jgi:cell division protein FtsB
MTSRLPRLSLSTRWALFFAIWSLILSGLFSDFLGPPGILQKFRLNNLLVLKEAQLIQAQSELSKLKMEAHLLETNRIVQEREVRRVLGYTAPDEIVFDFTSLDSY